MGEPLLPSVNGHGFDVECVVRLANVLVVDVVHCRKVSRGRGPDLETRVDHAASLWPARSVFPQARCTIATWIASCSRACLSRGGTASVLRSARCRRSS